MPKEVTPTTSSNKRSETTRRPLPSSLKPEDFSKKTLNSTDHSYRRELNSPLIKRPSTSSKSIYTKVLEESPNSSTRRALLKSSRS